MTPHDYMSKLDYDGTAYTVRFTLDSNAVRNKAVTSHNERWFTYRDIENTIVFVNFSHVREFLVETH